MKISICIPVYNFDVRDLVFSLKSEIELKEIDAEIILIDDASEKNFKEINKKIETVADDFIWLEKNVGRSQIRNLFLYYSKGDFLLFLDCDGRIETDCFLKNYVDFISENQNAQVVFGGRTVSAQPKDDNHLLRWNFAQKRENLPVAKRKENPFLCFQTNNFIIKRSVLKKINFNPEFQKYGYEDLLFAMDLKAKNIDIEHINNPVLNNDIESNSVYLQKVEESVDSLSKMLQNRKTAPKVSEIKLVKAYQYLVNSGLKPWFSKLFENRRGKTKEKLLRGNASLRYLDFYKLGLMCEKLA